MNDSFHAGAKQDITAAQEYYEQHAGLQVAIRFLDALQHVIGLLLQNPGLGTPTKKNRRVFPLHAFPYSVVYRTHGDHLRILMRPASKPKAWFCQWSALICYFIYSC